MTTDELNADGFRTRAGHIAWCKERALEYLDSGDTRNAFTSMMSDLTKHPETEEHMGVELGMTLLVSGRMSNPIEVRRFIEGFN